MLEKDGCLEKAQLQMPRFCWRPTRFALREPEKAACIRFTPFAACCLRTRKIHGPVGDTEVLLVLPSQ